MAQNDLLASVTANGPFSQELQAPQPQQYQQNQRPLSGFEGKTGQAANLIDSFFGGLSRGRALSYARDQQEKQTVFSTLSAQMQQVQQSDLPPEIKAQQLSKLGETRGHVIYNALDGDGSKSKGKKGGGQSSGDDTHPGSHILNAAKSVVAGMIGPGKAPGTVDPKEVADLMTQTNALLGQAPQISQQYNQQLSTAVNNSIAPLVKANNGQLPTFSQAMADPNVMSTFAKARRPDGSFPPSVQGVWDAMQAREKEQQGINLQEVRNKGTVQAAGVRADSAEKIAADNLKQKQEESKSKEDLASKKQATDSTVAEARVAAFRAQAAKSYAQAAAAREGEGEGTRGDGTRKDAKDIANSIVKGDQAPDLKSLYRLTGPVKAELSKKGYNLAQAELDWDATKKHLATLNGPQQTRIVEAVTALDKMIPDISDAYDAWQKTGLPNGFKSFNKAALAAAAQLPGEKGKAAQNLLTYINDAVSETGQIYMGGNSPTDHALQLAQTNLRGEWNADTFKSSLDILKKNLNIRRNSILNSPVIGLGGDSKYDPRTNGGTTPPPNARQASGTTHPPAQPQAQGGTPTTPPPANRPSLDDIFKNK